ncbi:MFS transporter [Pseudonocardia sp. WMMC193]|uniref:MFS transporter n=1 Tax=Pseudonocardia sp. WMMC193 TaxID=2911965 RepID=UPI001F00B396|nr:MFS transporter [Pseudonocardia sp. WMMC193]MCF7549554.1 MFS transporter [Pseudonocardia sp. WMMC193]
MPRTRKYSSRTVVATCLAITILDGFDLLVFGAALPVLLETRQWGMTAASAGVVGSLSLFGMLFGALVIGYLTDLLGRRPMLLACTACFALFTGLCAIAPSMEVFGALRFLAGLGFGGALPTLIALTMEYVRMERRQFANGVIQTGFPLGGAIVSVTAIFLLPTLGWRALFVLGGVLGLVLLAVAWRNLPESMAFLAARGRHDEARALAERYDLPATAESAIAVSGTPVAKRQSPIAALFAPGLRAATILFPLISICGLLVGYGMQTWTPQILRSTGYDLGSALTFMLMFNLGCIGGALFLNYSAGRWGPRSTIAGGFLLGAASVAVLSMGPPQALALLIMVVIGFCTGAQPAVYGFAGVYYPAAVRGTALGLAAGLGRLGGVAGPVMAGLIMGSAAGSTGVFLAFAAVGVLAAVLVGLVPRVRAAKDAPAAVVA